MCKLKLKLYSKKSEPALFLSKMIAKLEQAHHNEPAKFQKFTSLQLFVVILFGVINPCTPNVLFVGPYKTVQAQIRRRMIRLSTACLQNVLLKFEYK